MSSIIDLTGKPLDSAHKREHEPERVAAQRERLNALFVRMTQEWARDNATDPTGATQPNQEAVDQHYAKRWQEQAVAVLNSSDPVDVDPAAMANWIERERKAKQLKDLRSKPLSDAALRHHAFVLAHTDEHHNRLFVSTEAAVLLHIGGTVHVWVRPIDETPEVFVAMLGAHMAHTFPLVNCPDYTLGELLDLLGSLRRERTALPDAHALEALRKDLKEGRP